MISVSYTHLDVYKRQGQPKRRFLQKEAASGSKCLLYRADELYAFRRIKFAQAAKMTFQLPAFDIAAPVSYTHLDVYKRQIHANEMPLETL